MIVSITEQTLQALLIELEGMAEFIGEDLTKVDVYNEVVKLLKHGKSIH